MLMPKRTETEWYLPGRSYGCVDVDMALKGAAWDAAVDAHPVTQHLIREASEQTSPCVFCEARSTRCATFLESFVTLAGKPVVCVYTYCDACATDDQHDARIEERYDRDLWWLDRQYDLDGEVVEGWDDPALPPAQDAGPPHAWQMVLLYWERVPQEDRLALLQEALRRYTPAQRQAVRELLEDLDEADDLWADSW